MKQKLYIEYRLYFSTNAELETLHALAHQFQEHIYDVWNNDAEHGENLDVVDVTYEVTREVILDKDICKCNGATTMTNGETICSKCGKLQVN